MSATSTTLYTASAHAYRPGATLERPRGAGFALAPTIDGACAFAAWPLRVYELSVEPSDVRTTRTGNLEASACRVARELSATEILGPRAADVAAILDRIPMVGWCTPINPEPSEGWLGERLDAYMKARSACGMARPNVKFFKVRNLHGISDAPDTMSVYAAEHPPDEPMLYPPELFALVADPLVRRNARRVVARVAAKAVHAALWEAMWDALPPIAHDFAGKLRPRERGILDDALASVRGLAASTSRDVIVDLASGEGVCPASVGEFNRLAIEAFGHYIGEHRGKASSTFNVQVVMAMVRTLERAWTTAARIAAAASSCVRLLVNEHAEPTPWTPLLDLWLAGGVPILDIEQHLVVYWCCAFE